MFAAGLYFPMPQILEFQAFRDLGNMIRDFPGICLGNPEKTPGTATAFFRRRSKEDGGKGMEKSRDNLRPVTTVPDSLATNYTNFRQF